MLLSGGIDSAACLYLMKRKGYRNRALTVSFHRIAEGELAAAGRIAQAARVEDHRVVSIPELKEVGDIKENARFFALPRSYIPNRNMIFYSLAASYAEETGSEYIVGGHNADDAGVFADTRQAFFKNLQAAMWSASEVLRKQRTTILRPLQHMTKPEVVQRAAEIGVPLEMTWSCHREGETQCWNCDGCNGRTSAFRAAGIEDPLRKR